MNTTHAVDRSPAVSADNRPELFVDGWPHKIVKRDDSDLDSPQFVAVPMRIPADVPSVYWREGC